MCRADVHPQAAPALAALLDQLAAALAEQTGVPRDTITIGPIDLGPDEPERTPERP